MVGSDYAQRGFLDANMWNVDGEAEVTVESPVCWRCQEYGLSAGESCNLSVEEWQKRVICVTNRTNSKSIEKWLNKATTFLKY